MSASAPGPSPRAGSDPKPLRGIPRSRAFWELKAEQMMNRIFDPEEPIDLPVAPASAASPAANEAIPPVEPPPVATAPPAATTATTAPDADTLPPRAPRPGAQPDLRRNGAPPPPRRSRGPSAPQPGLPSSRRDIASSPGRFDERLLLIGALCGVCLVSVAASVLYFGYWNRLQQSLTQERNLLLVERLRSLGPATPSPVPGPEPITPTLPAPAPQATAGSTAGSDAPPPPPEEAWMEQLSSLPQAPRTPSRLLRVPVSPRLTAPPPAAAQARPPAMPPLPQLVGVVGSAGRAASAIFLVNGNSMSVSSGEPIGASGWRLRSAEGETALIERGGEVRQVSIVSGNGF